MANEERLSLEVSHRKLISPSSMLNMLEAYDYVRHYTMAVCCVNITLSSLACHRKLWKKRWVCISGAELAYSDRDPSDGSGSVSMTRCPVTAAMVIDR